jgi:hypothetical protein
VAPAPLAAGPGRIVAWGELPSDDPRYDDHAAVTVRLVVPRAVARALLVRATDAVAVTLSEPEE